MVNYDKIAKSILENVNTASAEEVWLHDGTKIDVADNETLNTAFRNEEAREKRAAEYPSIGDQLDSLYHAGVFPSDMEATLKAVKDKYPKEQ